MNIYEFKVYQNNLRLKISALTVLRKCTRSFYTSYIDKKVKLHHEVLQHKSWGATTPSTST